MKKRRIPSRGKRTKKERACLIMLRVLLLQPYSRRAIANQGKKEAMKSLLL